MVEPLLEPTFSIFRTTSAPEMTWPKTTCLPSSQSVLWMRKYSIKHLEIWLESNQNLISHIFEREKLLLESTERATGEPTHDILSYSLSVHFQYSPLKKNEKYWKLVFSGNSPTPFRSHSLCGGYEKLWSIRIRSRVGHWEGAKISMFQYKIFIGEFLSINWLSTSSIVICEVTTLTHLKISNGKIIEWIIEMWTKLFSKEPTNSGMTRWNMLPL